jgi:hypothetical protein
MVRFLDTGIQATLAWNVCARPHYRKSDDEAAGLFADAVVYCQRPQAKTGQAALTRTCVNIRRMSFVSVGLTGSAWLGVPEISARCVTEPVQIAAGVELKGGHTVARRANS